MERTNCNAYIEQQTNGGSKEGQRVFQVEQLPGASRGGEANGRGT